MRYLPIVFVVLTASVLSSCSMSDDGGSCPEAKATVITGLDQSILLAQSDAQQESGLVLFEFIQTPQPVSADRFMLAVVANAQFAASENNSPLTLLARIGNFFVSEANALSCIGPEFVSQQPLENITITSDAAVSALYPAGSNLATVFRVGKQIVSSPQLGVPSGAIVARAPENRESIAEFISAQPQVPLVLAMTLDVVDPVASQHVFTVTYTLDDGTIYTTQTEPVSITP